MSRFTDQDYLLKEQYKDASNLQARIDLHRRFSTNEQDWQPWIFEQFQIRPNSRILELGCGPGRLWLVNSQRIKDDWQITLSDFSPGMLEETKKNLGEFKRPIRFEVIDVQSIPFDDESFDVIIANHMLFFVPDLPTALEEIRRVLKPGGHFYASTTGHDHLAEMKQMIQRFDPDWDAAGASALFGLENGAEQLSEYFNHVKLLIYEDSLEITDVDAAVAFALSMISEKLEEHKDELSAAIQQEIEPNGSWHIQKDSGLFVAS